MPFIGLYMKADMEGVTKVVFPEGTYWTLDVRQSAGDEVRERITCSTQEEFEVPNSKSAKCNFMVKFEGAKAPSTMSVVTLSRTSEIKDKAVTSAALGSYSASGEMTPIAVFECRGLEPCKWYPVGPLQVETEGGQVFEEVDLSDPDGWMEADEDGNCFSIGALEFEFKPVR
mmetsp:Transcript_55835/g.103335  ORF Transcript_55835/g.103335 Transcript_55835/m.103335 type:complete len:172 (+) Transcript_55835:75-590(+)